jgi:TPP-dependent 2-oxoacid decarboxylase
LTLKQAADELLGQWRTNQRPHYCEVPLSAIHNLRNATRQVSEPLHHVYQTCGKLYRSMKAANEAAENHVTARAHQVTGARNAAIFALLNAKRLDIAMQLHNHFYPGDPVSVTELPLQPEVE